MSAYICNLNHIAYLVRANIGNDEEQDRRIGQMLWDENIKSVHHRYSGCDRDDLPGPCDCDYVYPEQAPIFDSFEPIQILKACDCYVYQSYEHPGWESSEASAYIAALRGQTWRSLPGYDDAKWGAPEPKKGTTP